MRQQLALILSRYANQPLTLDVARQILRDACPDENKAFPVQNWAPERWHGYELRAEHVAGNEADLAPIHAAYHEEVHSAEFDLNFDYARLREAERAGTLAMFTARFNGRLVGIMRVRLGFTLQSPHMTACDEMFYIEPAHRSWLAIRLWRYMERACFEHGVREVTFDSLTVNGAEKMARFLGYTQVAIKFHKVAHEGSDYSQLPTRHRKGVVHVSLAPN